MTPREFDGGVVQARLRLIVGLLDDLENVGELSTDQLSEDRMLRHAVERVLTQIVDLAVSVNSHVAATLLGESPKDYRSSFRLAAAAGMVDTDLADRLIPSVGLRNVLTHEYVEVDLSLVVKATQTARVDYRAYVHSVSEWLRRL